MHRIYQLAPKLSVEILAPLRRYLDYFDAEYWFAPATGTPSIILRMVTRLPNKSGPLILRRRTKFKNLFWFEFLIDFSHKKVEIFVSRHVIENYYFNAFGPFIQTNILEPVLYYCAIKKGIYILHTSTAVTDGKATCFIGKGGDGKTKTVLNECIKNNAFFMGDDLIFTIPKTKKVFWFPRPLHLFSYNINKIPPSPNKWLLLKLKAIAKMKDVIRFVLGLVTKVTPLISTRIDARELYPSMQLVPEAVLSKIQVVKPQAKSMKEIIIESSDLRKDLLSFLETMPKRMVSLFISKEQLLIKSLLS